MVMVPLQRKATIKCNHRRKFKNHPFGLIKVMAGLVFLNRRISMKSNILSFAKIILFAAATTVSLISHAQKLTVTPHADGSNIPVNTSLEGISSEPVSIKLLGPDGRVAPGQMIGNTLHWILPHAEKEIPQKWIISKDEIESKVTKAFSSFTKEGEYIDVVYDDKPISRLMTAFDTSSKERQFETYKVYSHIFDEEGKDFITKGAKGSFCHHRGIYIGWMRTGFQGKRVDSWHMNKASQRYQSTHSTYTGNVMGRITPVIEWITTDGTVFIREHRSLTFYAQPDDTITLVDFDTTLFAPNGDVDLAGDPEHAGIQYRPHNDVSKAKSAKFLFHEAGIDPKKDRDLPWVSLNYPLRGKNYHVQHMSHPSAPKGSIYSAYRDYGRFGAYPKTKISKGDSLRLRYRFLITKGAFPSREALHQNYTHFVHPPTVEMSAETK